MVLSQKSGFLICVFVFLLSSCAACGLCRDGLIFIILLQFFLCVGDSNSKALSYVWVIRKAKHILSNKDIKSNHGCHYEMIKLS